MRKNQPRKPPGTSSGGQYATTRLGEPTGGIAVSPGRSHPAQPTHLLMNSVHQASIGERAAAVTEWNRWRAENPDERVDLAGMNLSGCGISDVDLSGADLTGTNMSGAIMERANLKGAVLDGAHLEGAVLRKAKLDDAHATLTHFRDANMGGVTMHRSLLGGADMRGALMVDADLYAANLHAANLQRATLTYTDFSQAELGHADLSGTKMFGANFNGARCHRMKLEGADMRGALAMIHRDVCPATAVGDELVVAHRNPSTGTVAIWAPDQKFISIEDGRAYADTLDFELANEWNGYLGMVEARLAG